MPTTIEKFPKATTPRAKVDQIAHDHVDNGAVSSDVTEDDGNWIITTVLPEPAAP